MAEGEAPEESKETSEAPSQKEESTCISGIDIISLFLRLSFCSSLFLLVWYLIALLTKMVKYIYIKSAKL